MTADALNGPSPTGFRVPAVANGLAAVGGKAAAAPKSASLASGGASGSAIENAAAARRTAKAIRDFQAVFLMEMMKPLTQALSGASSEETASAGLGLSSGADVYSYFWGEALAQHLAEALPGLPGITEVEDLTTSAAGVAGVPGRTGLSRSVGRASQLASMAGVSAEAPASNGGAASEFEPLAAGVTLDGISSLAALRAARTAPADATGVAASSAPAKAASGAASGLSAEIQALAEKAGRLFSLPENLVRAVVAVESGGRPNAVSNKGAVGLMQLMPGTAKEMGVKDATDAWENLVGGAKYLARQLERFGSLDQALAAYNAGPGAVEKHAGVPPYPETREYVRRVLSTKAGLDRVNPGGA